MNRYYCRFCGRYYCRFCGKKIEKWTRADALYCSDYCKKKEWDILHERTEANKIQESRNKETKI